MRPIQFRAWDGRKMFDVDVLAINQVTWDSSGTGVSIAYQPHIKVMQYTGLIEKNGNDIYEGDICKLWAEEPYHNENFITDYDWEMVGEIIYRQGAFWFENDSSWIPLFDYATSDMELEIIGNIYEDKHLLEVMP